MESACFGFGEDETESDNAGTVGSNVFRPNNFRFCCTKKTTVPTPTKGSNNQTSNSPTKAVSISDIQELLLRDSNPEMNSTMINETSFYEDQTENITQEISPIKMKKKKKIVEKSNENSVHSKPVTRRRAAKNMAKKENENSEIHDKNADVNEPNSSIIPVKVPIRVFTKPSRNKKPLKEIQNCDESTVGKTIVGKNALKRKGKIAVENENNERVDKLAEQINSQFKQVEEFQLLVE